MNKLISIAAAAFVAFIAAPIVGFIAPASAQMVPYGMPNAANGYDLSGMGMPDFTGVDLNRINSDMEARRNAEMNRVTATIIAQVLSNPYAIQVLQSGACGYGSAQQLAYIYAATAGCTPEGIAEYGRVTNGIIQRDQSMWSAMSGQ